MKSIYLNNSYFFTNYIESNMVCATNNTNSNKYKLIYIWVYLINNNKIFRRFNLFNICTRNNKNNKKFNIYKKKVEYNEIEFYKGTIYNFQSKIKIIGRGWKIMKSSNVFIIKLGYSHPLFLALNPFIKYKIKKKKKKYYNFYGTFFNSVNRLSNRLYLMRIPNVYTRKGIFNRTYIL